MFDPFGYYALINLIRNQGEAMSAELDTLKTQVTGIATAVQSAVLLLTTLKADLDAAIASGVPASALTDLSTQLGSSTQALTDAVARNTPAPTPPTP